MQRGHYSVAVRCGNIQLISCYISPNVPIEEYFEFLNELGDIVQSLNGRRKICGDYNAKSALWGSPNTDRRGALFQEWAAENEFRLANISISEITQLSDLRQATRLVNCKSHLDVSRVSWTSRRL
ncbi:reverse transcriptase [Lasius niger]|uniref:Reverse transcriptase n=1 Tax=Lasius niger TaxID=67767 RepID=A0A0J7KCK0_LASNI|nr:reverse transcriptase [Lasius niger]